MSAELNYDEGPLLDVAMACRRFIAEVEGLPAAAVMLMVPALCQHLEDCVALELMHGREVQLGRELTPEECEEEAAFVGEELLRGEGEAQERMPDLLYMLRLDTLVKDEDPREMPEEERKNLFSALVSEPEPIGSAIRASQDFWKKMIEQEVDLETRLLVVSHLQGVCMHFMLTEEIDRRKMELGRGLSKDELGAIIDQVTRQRNGIELMAKSRREELEDLVSKLGKHARPPPAKSPDHLLYIA